MSKYAENMKVLPLQAPVDIVATATATKYIDVGNAVGPIELAVQFGAITSTDTAGGCTVTIEASTASSSNATESAIAFRYRLSAAVDTDTMGAITAATATGVRVLEATDNVVLLCYVEPEQLAAAGADFKYLRVVETPSAEVTATLVGAVARFPARYAGNSMPAST